MTFLRQLSVNTLRTVIWLSSPATQTWAKAMLAELDSIGSDWKALFWAIGSLRVLFVRRASRPASLSEIPAVAKGLAVRMNLRARLSGAWLLGLTFFFGWTSFHAPNTLQQIGAALIGVAMLYLLFQVVSGRPKQIPPHADLPDQLALYRSELIRERDFHRGRLLWLRLAVLVPGLLLLCIGNIAANPSTVRSQVITSVFCFLLMLIAIPNNLRFARRYARQLQELELLEPEGFVE